MRWRPEGVFGASRCISRSRVSLKLALVRTDEFVSRLPGPRSKSPRSAACPQPQIGLRDAGRVVRPARLHVAEASLHGPKEVTEFLIVFHGLQRRFVLVVTLSPIVFHICSHLPPRHTVSKTSTFRHQRRAKFVSELSSAATKASTEGVCPVALVHMMTVSSCATACKSKQFSTPVAVVASPRRPWGTQTKRLAALTRTFLC